METVEQQLNELNKNMLIGQIKESELFPYNGYIKEFGVDKLVLSDILSNSNQAKKFTLKDLVSWDKKKNEATKLYSCNSVQLLIKNQSKTSKGKMLSLSLGYMCFFIIPIATRLIILHKFISRRSRTPFTEQSAWTQMVVNWIMDLMYVMAIAM